MLIVQVTAAVAYRTDAELLLKKKIQFFKVIPRFRQLLLESKK